MQKRVDGEQIQIEADIHPDPLVESVRYQICEVELIQTIGRPSVIYVPLDAIEAVHGVTGVVVGDGEVRRFDTVDPSAVLQVTSEAN